MASVNDQIVIYGLKCPIDGEIHYIGQAMNLSRRISDHLRDKGINPKTEWLNRLKDAGLRPEGIVLEITDSASFREAESKWIHHGNSLGWPLTNLTHGGEGYSHQRKVDVLLRRIVTRYDLPKGVSEEMFSLSKEDRMYLLFEVCKKGVDHMRLMLGRIDGEDVICNQEVFAREIREVAEVCIRELRQRRA